MDNKRKERLVSAGWAAGNAEDILWLTSEEALYVELRLYLSRKVRLQRQVRGLSQKALAEILGSSQSRVAKIEAADPSVSIDLMVRSLFAMGADLRVFEDLPRG